MADEEIVSEEQVSGEEQVSAEGELTQEVSTPQALTEERVQQMIANATAVAVEQAKGLGRRELQSQQDRNKAEVAEAQRRARFAEDSLAKVKSRYGDLDPEVRQTLETEELRTQVGHYQLRDEEQLQYQQMMATVNVFEGNLAQYITDMGINPNDKRIDWGDKNSMNLTQRQDKVLKSVAKIQKENGESATARLRQELKDEMQQFRKDQGLDSHDTSASAGVGGSDAEFLDKFGKGEVPSTKENVERANKIMNK